MNITELKGGEPLKNGNGFTNGPEDARNGRDLTSFEPKEWELVQGENGERLGRVDRPSLIQRMLRWLFH